MSELTEVEYTTQFCRGGYEISGGLYDEVDADLVRYWEGDFCLVELTRDGGAWKPTGGDSTGWVGLADNRYNDPIDALQALLPDTEYTLIAEDS